MSVWSCVRILVERKGGKEVRTTLRVPMMTFGGDCLPVTISEMKLAVIPMMLIRQIASMDRTTVKVTPRAPKLEGIFEDSGADRI